jgi:exodeoxyribonuclease V beta subunit
VTANKPKTPKNKPVLPDLSPSALLLRSPKLGLLKDKDGPLINLEPLISPDENIRFRTLSKQTQKRPLQKWDDEHELKARWSVGSYSGLTRGISHEPVLTEPDLTVPEGIFAFPKGADAGIALHSVFERIDFIDAARIIDPPPEEIVRLIEGILTDSGFSPKKEPENVNHVIAMVKNVMQSVIPDVAPKFRLGGLRGENRLAEMEFHLAAGHPDCGKAPVTAMKLKEALGSEVGQISDGKQLNGFLNGFIDLVFRHDGKWWILDWKSNHLGNSASCYGREALERAMKEHNYHLQYHFYTAALTRYLTVASGGDFAYERDFGGVLYLFIRGVDGTGNGIYCARPDRDVMERLEDIL